MCFVKKYFSTRKFTFFKNNSVSSLPEECIDCDACVEACPVDACFAEDQLPEEWNKYIDINANYYKEGAGA